MNSGILLMNLRAMRINGVEEKIRKFIKTKFLMKFVIIFGVYYL